MTDLLQQDASDIVELVDNPADAERKSTMHGAEGTQMGMLKDKEGSENVMESVEAKI